MVSDNNEIHRNKKDKSILRAHHVEELSNQYSISNIENSLVSLFLEEHEIYTKNILIQKILEETDDSIKYAIKNWLSIREIEPTLKNIERIFELLLDDHSRKFNGSFYTPKIIVDYIIDASITKDTKTVCDCSCGSGAFLVESAYKLHVLTKHPISEIIEKSIFGMDILERGIYRTKIILTLLMLETGEDKKFLNFNLQTEDSLFHNWDNVKFDAVIGNPPYIGAKNLTKKMRDRINEKWKLISGKTDMFIPFVELGLKLTHNNGIMGYIIPNSYFTSKSSTGLRRSLRNNQKIREIVDFKHLQIFQDATTYTCITIFGHKKKNTFNYSLFHDDVKLQNLGRQQKRKIHYSDLGNEWRLLSAKDIKNIKILENIGFSLKELCKIHTGLATLNNDVYLIENSMKKKGYVQKLFNGKNYDVEVDITKPIVKGSRLKNAQQVLDNTSRIIFPYTKKDSMMKIIPENIMKTKYPKCYSYLLERKTELESRDKGTKKYATWYAYGRTQGLQSDIGDKLITPDIGNSPNFVFCSSGTLFYNGFALWITSKETNLNLHLLRKILNSKIFKYYIHSTSRNYHGGFKSYAKHFLENFSIPLFNEKELKFIDKSSKIDLDNFLLKKYKITI